MNTSLDCIPCLLRQALDTARMYSDSAAVHEQILRDVLLWCGNMDMSKPAPVMGQRIYRRLRELTGVQDPYLSAKVRQNQLALRLLPELRAELARAKDPFELAVKFAIAGNIIDMGAAGDVSLPGVRKALAQAIAEPLSGAVDSFRRAAQKAETVLYLTDNAGEIVFDTLLIELLGPAKVTAAVRGAPAINDAVLEDAQMAGLADMVKVIDNGSDAPGTVLSETSEQFNAAFKTAGMVIAKGQGNYETLSDSPRLVYFLFKAKCPIIAKRAGVTIGSQVLQQSNVNITAVMEKA